MVLFMRLFFCIYIYVVIKIKILSPKEHVLKKIKNFVKISFKAMYWIFALIWTISLILWRQSSPPISFRPFLRTCTELRGHPYVGRETFQCYWWSLRSRANGKRETCVNPSKTLFFPKF